MYLAIAAVLYGQVLCRPGWSNHQQPYNSYHHFQALPVIHHDSLLITDFHEGTHLIPTTYHNLRFSNHPVQGHELTRPYHGPIAVPVVLPSGHLADTPEVSASKVHHLSAVAKARADKYYNGHSDSNYGGAYGYSGSYHGYAVHVVLPNGHIADTEEVATAKSAHLLAVAKAKADKYYSGQGEGYGYGDYGYSGSFHGYGIPVVLPNGHIADTHEVAAAKSAHLVAVEHAKAEQAHSHNEYLEGGHHYVLYEPYSDSGNSYGHEHFTVGY